MNEQDIVRLKDAYRRLVSVYRGMKDETASPREYWAACAELLRARESVPPERAWYQVRHDGYIVMIEPDDRIIVYPDSHIRDLEDI